MSGQTQNMMTVAYTQRYVDLIRLVNKQRDTISAQQADLTKVSENKHIIIQTEIYSYYLFISV